MEPNAQNIAPSELKTGRFFPVLFICIAAISGGLILLVLNWLTQRNSFFQDLASGFYILNLNVGGLISNTLFILMIISAVLFVYFLYKKKYSYATLFVGISFFAIVIPIWSSSYIHTPGGGEPLNSERFCITDSDPSMSGCQ